MARSVFSKKIVLEKVIFKLIALVMINCLLFLSLNFLTEISLNCILGIFGILLPIQISLVKIFSKEKKRIISYIPIPNSDFSRNIKEGLHIVFKKYSLFILIDEKDKFNSALSLLENQINIIRDIEQSHAIVIHTNGIEGQLFHEVAKKIRSGVTVVVIGQTPEDDFFTELELQPPISVYYNTYNGGLLLSEKFFELTNTGSYDAIIYLAGPNNLNNWRQSRSIPTVYELCKSKLNCRLVVLELVDHYPENTFSSLIGEINNNEYRKVMVIANSDGLRLKYLVEKTRELPFYTNIDFIGYGGDRTIDGKYVADVSNVLFTIDLKPIQRGIEAGYVLQSLYNNEKITQNHIEVKPDIVVFNRNHRK